MNLHSVATAAFAFLAAHIAAPSAEAQGCPNEDIYAPNHTCATARPMGSTVGLFEVELVVSNDDPDYFFIDMDGGSELYARVEFLHSEGNIDLELFRDFGCDAGAPVASSTGTGDFEVVTRPAQDNHVLKISRTGGPGTCSSYRLWLMQERNSTLGGTICAGGTNSTGQSASFSAFGSLDVSVNNLTLSSSSLPLNSFGYYLNSRGVGFFQPAGSQGFLCINQGGVGRYVRPGEIQDSGNMGFTTLSIDLSDIPRPTGAVSAVVGDRYAFQYWYRDTSSSGPPVSQFSAAVVVWLE